VSSGGLHKGQGFYKGGKEVINERSHFRSDHSASLWWMKGVYGADDLIFLWGWRKPWGCYLIGADEKISD